LTETGGNKSKGVLLLNLGGPDSIDAVRPFLFNLFSDRDIIRLGPAFMQKPLAYLISALRHKKTERFYKLIGGKSPIREITAAQARALEEEINGPEMSDDGLRSSRVYYGMRYWHPLIEDVVPAMYEDGIRRVVVLSLYPQYSIATSGSSLSKLKDVLTRFPIKTFSISTWFDNALYIDALVDMIKKGIFSFHPSSDRVHILFSAHSLPKKFIDEGDPYLEQIRGTITEIAKKIEITWDLAFQSKSGPVLWLEPSTDEMIKKLAQRGIKNLLVVPVSFVSDHIETLYEIDILYKEMAVRLGIKLKRTESLNTSPLFISALKDIVLRGMKEAGWA
jgi:protoporphyrin/coproporphyrin ferrochelatase